LGELKRAEQLFSSVIQSLPAYGPAWGALGQVQFAQGHDQEAEANFRRAIDLSDRKDARKIKNDLAVLWESRGKRSEAVALLQSIVSETAPGRERLRMLTNLGAWQSRLGHHQDSLQSLAAALTEAETTVGPSHPDTAQVLQALGQALQKAGRKADARQVRQRAHSLTAEFAAQTNAGSATVDVRDLKE
jgi:tetratricopeptide (TPR) repeat protein